MTQAPSASPSQLARQTLAALLLTFLLSRILVLLIMTRRIPDLFLHLGQTHVHHLNYGIFLLCAVGAWLLFAPPTTSRPRTIAAILYGIGLALTFDEFGMWLHLGGSYWQRASYDAVVTIAALLSLLAFAPALRHFTLRLWILTAAIIATVALFAFLATDYLRHVSPTLEKIEQQGPR